MRSSASLVFPPSADLHEYDFHATGSALDMKPPTRLIHDACGDSRGT